MRHRLFEQPEQLESSGILLDKKPKEAFRAFLRQLCGVTPLDSLTFLACRFYGELDWNSIKANLDQVSTHHDYRQVNLAFPIDQETDGLMQVYEWHDSDGQNVWGVGLTTSEAERMVFHRLSAPGPAMAAGAFYRSLVA